MPHWSPDDIPWAEFDAAKLSPDILVVIKAAAMVERNAPDYTLYLNNVFREDPEFKQLAVQWQAEEVQHGDVLGRYAELADPGFDFQQRFKRFTDGYKVPIEPEQLGARVADRRAAGPLHRRDRHVVVLQRAARRHRRAGAEGYLPSHRR
ncbi:MAG: acyl-ACP desaturase [Magnetospirillum sp.]|nr:acyl-ACP desaturase [Magnetospirillum sp.]